MTNQKEKFRLDFKIEVTAFDEQTGMVEMVWIPDPRRYEWVNTDEGRFLYDKMDELFFPEEVFEQLIAQLPATPMYYQAPEISSAEEYVEGRSKHIRERLTARGEVETLEEKPQDFLQSFQDDSLQFAVLSVDIAGSTLLSTKLPSEKYNLLIQTFIYEISSIVPKFHGHILKYTGDGLIAYFPEPSFIRMNDLALDSALTMRLLVYDGLNPILDQLGYPKIDIRIGIDSGRAFLVVLGDPKAKRERDIIGSVVNLAAKIQGKAERGGIAIGETTYRNLHISWREKFEKIPLDTIDWTYESENGEIYQLYQLLPHKSIT